MTYSMTISRATSKKVQQAPNAREISSRCLRGKNKWRVTKVTAVVDGVYNAEADKTIYSYKINFLKDGKGKNADQEWAKIVDDCKQLCSAGKWNETPWLVSSIEPEPISSDEQATPDQPSEDENVRAQFGLSNKILSFDEVKEKCLPLINEILDNEAKLHEVFWGIFDREPQIRTVMSSVKSFLATDRQRRNHVLLYGLPACAKTQILLRFCDFVGEGAVIKIDATNTTQAGIAKLFFDELDDEEIPPFVVIEEMEKSHEDILRIWLGITDERGEIRKMNFNQNRFKKINVLALGTANDKSLFDKLMGGNANRPGALSSRFVNQLYCQRPDEKVMRLILKRDIEKFGGKLEWIDPIIKLSHEINTNDPRKILSYLDGGDRLLTGEYQDDLIKVVDRETNEMNEDPSHIGVDVEALNNIIKTKMAG